jgi:hypothetical protein
MRWEDNCVWWRGKECGKTTTLTLSEVVHNKFKPGMTEGQIRHTTVKISWLGPCGLLPYIATNIISFLPSPICTTHVGCLNLKYSMNTDRNFPPGVTFTTPNLVKSPYGKDFSPLPCFLISVLQ